MLSFDSALSNALKLGNTTAFWVLKLYYNDDSTATNFIGVSDTYRVDGSDTYYGLVSSWGNYSQSLDFFNFTTSTGNMTVKLINTEQSIKGGRFTDLLSTNNFANRKWELFLNTAQAGTYDTSDRMIGTGVISGNIKHDMNSVSFILLDKSSIYHKQIPTATVTSALYPEAPEKNLNKPVPISCGDFSRNTEDDYYKYFDIKGAFPAIITNRCDSDGKINALPDTNQGSAVRLNLLSRDNIYMSNSGEILNALSANVTVTSAPTNAAQSIIKAKGTNYFYQHLLTDSFSTSTRFDGTANIVDDSLTSYQTYNSGSLLEGSNSGELIDSLTFNIPTVPKLGEIYENADIQLILKTSNEASGGAGTEVTLSNGTGISPAITTDGIHIASLSNKYSASDLSSASLDSVAWTLKSQTATDAGDNSLSYRLLDMWIMIEFYPSQIFTKNVLEEHERINVSYVNDGTQFERDDNVTSTVVVSRTRTFNTPAEIEYLYYSGKGREYKAWIDADSRNNGYNEQTLLENPIYIIEDTLRTELGLVSANIDYATFDLSGNTTSGYLGDIFNDAVSDVKFAFSQYKFINSKDYIERLCRQCFSWVFISGDGKVNINTLRRDGDYTASDKTIDFKEISLKGISKTKLNAVRNDITVNYAQDYVQDQFKDVVNVTDSTSIGTTVNGNNQSLKLETDADVLDITTATAMANANLIIFKDRKNIISFNTTTPKYNNLEIGDIIDFSNWDTKIKLFGVAMDGYWMITSISKNVSSANISVIQVEK